MLSWISDTFYAMIAWIPIWLYAEDTPRYYIVRSVLGVGLLVLVMLFFAVRPDRAVLEGYRRYREERYKDKRRS